MQSSDSARAWVCCQLRTLATSPARQVQSSIRNWMSTLVAFSRCALHFVTQ